MSEILSRQWISIHTLRVEGDGDIVDFPSRGEDISIHTLRVEGDEDGVLPGQMTIDNISIHTLRVEGDYILNVLFTKDGMISIHTLRVEGDRQRTIRQNLP